MVGRNDRSTATGSLPATAVHRPTPPPQARPDTRCVNKQNAVELRHSSCSSSSSSTRWTRCHGLQRQIARTTAADSFVKLLTNSTSTRHIAQTTCRPSYSRHCITTRSNWTTAPVTANGRKMRHRNTSEFTCFLRGFVESSDCPAQIPGLWRWWLGCTLSVVQKTSPLSFFE